MVNSGYFYLVIIYIVWGITYLAMRVGVGPQGGFPVFLFGSLRCLGACLLLLTLAKVGGQFRRPNVRQVRRMAWAGILGSVFAQGPLLVALQFVDSGFAAVAVSMSPIWVLVLGSLFDRKLPKPAQVLFILIGFFGVAALIGPHLGHDPGAGLLGMVLLMISPISWACATLFIERHPAGLPMLMVSGCQQLFGGLGLMVMSILFREPAPHPTLRAWGALGFLIVFGSALGYTAFIKALSILPARVVATNAYVNPAIAVILGWMILAEPVTPWTLLAMLLVTIAVSGILQSDRPQEAKTAVVMAAAIEE